MRTPLAILLVAAAPLAAQYSVTWEHDMASAMKRARAEKKLILLDLWAEWCGPCQFLKNKVFPTPEAQAALGKVVPLSVMVEYKDRRPLEEGKRLAQQFNLEGYPTLLVLDENGKELRRQVGAFSSGSELARWLESR